MSLGELIRIAHKGKKADIECYVKRKGEIHLQGNSYWEKSPLLIAAYYGNFEIVEYLLDKNDSNANIQDSERNTILHKAVEAGHLELTRFILSFLEEKNQLNYYEKLEDRTPLHYASDKGHTQIVELLLKKGFNANAKNKGGGMLLNTTPLHLANNLEVAEMLLQHGADPNSRDELSNTPLHWVRDSEIAKVLLKYGAMLNVYNQEGKSALHIVSNGESIYVRDRPKLVETLLECGVDPNVRDNEKKTPLHWPINAEIARILLVHGADPISKDEDGKTPLHWTMFGDYGAIDDHVEVARVLLSFNADPNAKDNEGRTPLHEAVFHVWWCYESGFNSGEAVTVLLQQGADPNLTDNSGLTPLQYWARAMGDGFDEGFWEIAAQMGEKLLKYGADPNVRDHMGRTPLHQLAVVEEESEKFSKLLMVLLNEGANREQRDNDGNKPVHIAKKPEILVILSD